MKGCTYRVYDPGETKSRSCRARGTHVYAGRRYCGRHFDVVVAKYAVRKRRTG